ncbi:MAG: prolipoprotein diacylglyceryl transferase [Parvularculaceae bacterium]
MTVPYPAIDPVAIHLGPVPIRWYSLAYIAGIGVGWWYALSLLKKSPLWPPAGPPVSKVQLDDVIFWVAVGVMAGGRLGYVFFYEPSLLVGAWQPLGATMADGLIKTLIGWIPSPPFLMLWKGGMSFHGGLLGVTIAGIWYARRNKVNALSLGDLFSCAAPIGLFFGRIANFINGELYGRPWDGKWAMVFPADNLGVPRHPSQLYEAALEGVALFAIVTILTRKFGLLKRPGATMGVFLAGYSLSRIIVENFREPDAFLPNFPLGLTMGMMLSAPMFALGAWFVWRAFRNPQAGAAKAS